MSDKKQIIKLYTKEDFLKAAEFCEVSIIDVKYIIERINEVTDPIELPSNDEIKDEYYNGGNYKKQSSIDWLIGQLKAQYDIDIERLTVTDKAKAMHKEEIKNTQMDMFIHLNNLHYGLEYLKKRQSAEDFSEQYYNKTFNSDEG